MEIREMSRIPEARKSYIPSLPGMGNKSLPQPLSQNIMKHSIKVIASNKPLLRS